MAAKMVDYAQKTLEMKQRMRKLDEALLHKKNPHNHLNALIVAALQLKDWLEKNDNHK
jgi:hypothetical protein